MDEVIAWFRAFLDIEWAAKTALGTCGADPGSPSTTGDPGQCPDTDPVGRFYPLAQARNKYKTAEAWSCDVAIPQAAIHKSRREMLDAWPPLYRAMKALQIDALPWACRLQQCDRIGKTRGVFPTQVLPLYHSTFPVE